MDQRTDVFNGQVFASIGTRRLRDLLLHECSAEIVAARRQAELRKLHTEFHPRGLHIDDVGAEHEPGHSIDLEIQLAFRGRAYETFLVECRVRVNKA